MVLISQIHRSWPTIPTPVSVWPYPKAPNRKETIRRRMSGVPKSESASRNKPDCG